MAEDPAEAQKGAETPDYSQETLEQLEERFAKGEGLIIQREDEPELDFEPQEPEPEPEVEAQSDEPAAAEPPGEQEAEPRRAQIASPEELEELRLQLQLSNTAREKSELLGGRAASELGELRKQVQQLRAALSQQPDPEEDGNVDYGRHRVVHQAAQPIQSPYIGQLEAKVAGLEQAERTRAAEAEYNAFVAENFNGDTQKASEFLQSASSSIQQQFAPYEGMNLDSTATRRLLRLALNTSLAEHKLATLRAQTKQRAASQVPEKKKAKQAATVSGSGGSPAPKARPKRPEEMTAEEADAELIRQLGDGHYKRVGR